MNVDEEQQLEPKIEEFLVCLAPHEEYVLEDPLGIVMKNVGQGSFANWEFSGHWYESVIQSLTSISQHFLTSRSCEELIHHIWELINTYFSTLDMSIPRILICIWLHWKYAYT